MFRKKMRAVAFTLLSVHGLMITATANAQTLSTVDWDWESAYSVTANGNEYCLPWWIGCTSNVPYDVAVDHRRNEGWELLWSNFDGHLVDASGNAVQTVFPHPFFALYNRYRGVARFYYLHLQDISTSEMLYGLSFEHGADSETALLNYSFEFADPVEARKNMPFVAQANLGFFGVSGPAIGHWNSFEVEFTYDDDVEMTSATDLIMRWAAKGVNTSELEISGTSEGAITGNLSLAGSSSNFLSVGNLLRLNVDRKSTVSITQTNQSGANIGAAVASKAAKQKSSKLKKLLNDTVDAILKNASGQISALAGKGLTAVLNHFVGGAQTTGPTHNLNARIQTRIQLAGEIRSELPVFNRTLKVPGTDVGDNFSGMLPHYDTPLGVLGISERPDLVWKEWFEYTEESDRWEYYQNYVVDNESYVVTMNPAVADELEFRDITSEVIFLQQYSGQTRLDHVVDGMREPDLIGGELSNDTDADRWYRNAYGMTVAYDGVRPVPWGGWDSGDESWEADERMLVRITVRLGRVCAVVTPGCNPDDEVLWSKLIRPDYIPHPEDNDPLAFVRGFENEAEDGDE